ncbi:hypothetical protein ACNKHM_26320 [Shigella sonnei]
MQIFVIMWATSGICASLYTERLGGPASCPAFRCGHSLRQSVGHNQEVMEHPGGYTPLKPMSLRMLLPGRWACGRRTELADSPREW